MDQRFFLAIALSMVVMVGWYAIFPPAPSKPPAVAGKQQETQPPGQKAPSTPALKPAQPAKPEETAPEAEKVKARNILVNTPLYFATFTNRGAVLSDFRLKPFSVEKENISWGDLIPGLRGLSSWFDKEPVDTEKRINMASQAGPQNPIFGIRFSGEESLSRLFREKNYSVDREAVHLASGQSRPEKLVMRYQHTGGLSVTKTFIFHPDSYVVDFSMKVVNRAKNPKTLSVAALFGEGPEKGEQITGFGSHQGPIWRAEDSISTEDADDISGTLQVPKSQWLGVTNTYFITAAQPVETKISYGFFDSREVRKDDATTWAAAFGMELNQATLRPGEAIEGNFKLYLGPRRVADMEKFQGNLESSIHMNLGVLGRPMLSLMRWFYSFTENFGVAIILLTIVVRLLLFPLTYKGMLNIKRMQKLQPRMAALKEKFKKDKEKLNKEMMGLYRKHKMNPLGGCLPILLQIPIFYALYIALSGAIELRHEPFIFWITDLSALDGLYVTPLLMGASMVLQQKLSPTAMDPTQAKIMMMMPIVFTFFMMQFPSGLVVYWLTSNVLSILQQLIINRIKVPEPAE